MALLRWWRFLASVEVASDRATRTDVRDLVLWMRSAPRTRARSEVGGAGRSAIGRGYAPATINHNLAVLRGFYADRMAAGATHKLAAMQRGADRKTLPIELVAKPSAAS